MEQKPNQLEKLKTDFDREIKALISVMAEICIHEYLNQTEKETEDVKEQ